MIVLALECSTSAAKALVYDTARGVLSQSAKSFDTCVSDGVTQDADSVFEALASCAVLACEQAGTAADAVVLISTWHSLLLCRSDGSPAGRVRLWSDLGAADYAAGLSEDEAFRRRFYERTGCVLHATYPIWKYAYLKSLGQADAGMQLYAQGEYIFRRLTGVRAVSKNIASGSGVFNLKTLDWDEDLLKTAGINRKQLGALCDEAFCAPLTGKAAEKLGLPQGTPVYAGGADGAMTQLGCGADGDGIMTMSVGTSAALRMACEKPLLPEAMSNWCYYLTCGRYIAGAATNGACNCVNQFQEQSGLPIKQLDAMLPESDFTDAPVFLPFLYGERCPGWNSRPYGGFCDENGGTAQKYYAVLEGVLFNLYQCYAPLAAAGCKPREIRLSGGILNCRYWLQMCADIFGCEIHASAFQHASMLGGVAIAAKAGGEDIGARLWKTDFAVAPDSGRREFYKARFEKYIACYNEINAG